MQFDPGVLDGELPGDGGAPLVAGGLPGGDFGDEGCPVVAVADGLDGIRRPREGRPSLVLLDPDLPYVNGDEVGTRIRAGYHLGH